MILVSEICKNTGGQPMDMETETAQVKVIAHIRSDFSTKFGILVATKK